MIKDGSGMPNAFDPERGEGVSPRSAELIRRREAALGPAYRLFYQTPIEFVSGDGVWLTSQSGERYLDGYNNVASVGHCHPHVVAAIARQAAQLNTHTRYLSTVILDYAERLLATFPAELEHVVFTCTGSEANDFAMRIAKARTGAQGVIVTASAYHGVTDAIAAISPALQPGRPLPDHVRAVAAPDLYREGGGTGGRFVRDIEAAIASLQASGHGVAAFYCDTIFSSDGVLPEAPGLAEAVAAVRHAGGLFVADEVQPGFGRTGGGMWGFARHGLVPDLATLGKPMANGHPVAAVVMRNDVVADFAKNNRYFNTFGGNPVSCAAAAATLDVIEQEGLIANAGRVGAYLAQGLGELATRFAVIGDIRQAGLFIGVEIVADRASRAPDGALAHAIVNALARQRILISASGPHANVLKIRPPLPFSTDHADILLAGIAQVLTDPGL